LHYVKTIWMMLQQEVPEDFDIRGRCAVPVDIGFFRPSDVENVAGGASKAREKLYWKARMTIREIVEEMVPSDLRTAQHERTAINSTIQVQE
jgi:GDPmannose 4,6-dehydratase